MPHRDRVRKKKEMSPITPATADRGSESKGEEEPSLAPNQIDELVGLRKGPENNVTIDPNTTDEMHQPTAREMYRTPMYQYRSRHRPKLPRRTR